MVLPDLNVLIALTWPNHVHHALTQRWFSRQAGAPWYTCDVTQQGFIRLSSNPSVVKSERSPREALTVLRSLVSHPDHQYLDKTWEMANATIPESLLYGYRQVTDCYLVGLAFFNDLRLATLDRRLASTVEGTPWESAVQLITA